MGGIDKFRFGVGVALLEPVCLLKSDEFVSHLTSLAADPAGKLNILGHDCHTLGVNRAQVSVLKETN
jgi:hypothetical protein